MSKIRTLIIDDESLARELIIRFLSDYDQFNVLGEAENGFEAIKLINDLKPELIFLDVQMPKISGLELLELLEEPFPFIIFSTAYDSYAVQAFEKNAVDYLLKPYNKDRFNRAIEKFMEEFKEKENKNHEIKMREFVAKEIKILDKLLVRQGSKIIVIPVDQISYISAEDDYVSIHTLTHKYLKHATISFFEDSLPGFKFVRIHRSFLINIDFLIQLELYDRSTYTAIMKNNERLPVSRTGSTRLKELLGE